MLLLLGFSFVPVDALSELWMWKGHAARRFFQDRLNKLQQKIGSRRRIPTNWKRLSLMERPGYAQIPTKLELNMKKSVAVESASALIDERIKELADWRGKTLAKVRGIIHKADPEIVEEWKWEIPVFSHAGIVCTGETYKSVVKLTFANGAALKDPSELFNSSLAGNVRRAIDIRENEKIDEPALKDLIREAVALNLHLKSRSKPKPKNPSRRRSNKRAL